MPTPKSISADGRNQLESIGLERYVELRDTRINHADLLLMDSIQVDRPIPINFWLFAIIIQAYANTKERKG